MSMYALSDMEEAIRARLADIALEEGVRILYACESGSRAWGFASPDSDFDVRFIYVRPLEAYLSIEERRDVIEAPISEALDINGWDLPKALKLLRKSNPPLLEWLGSPIVYLEHGPVASELRRLAPQYFSARACSHHYFNLARNNFEVHLTGEQVRLKKLFYSLRPVLALRWIEAGLGVVPTAFGTLMERVVDSSALRGEIETLLAAKTKAGEAERVPRVAAIHEFLEAELERFGRGTVEYPKVDASVGPLDAVFRAALTSVDEFVN